MLAVPTKGFAKSATVHNVDLGICCDWLEASALFFGDSVTGADVVDVLVESGFYASQQFAWTLVEDVFGLLQYRSQVIGEAYPLRFSGVHRLEAKAGWQDFPDYSFCLTLSLAEGHAEWARTFGKNYTAQGELFENLTAEAVAKLLDWEVHTTGWSRTRVVQLTKVVREVADRLGETLGNVKRWSKERGKEAGLDLLSFKRFPDGRPGLPAYLWQCASGKDWDTKLKTPDLRMWGKMVDFTVSPMKGFSMPWAMVEGDFIHNAMLVDGLLLDRHRLLAAGFADRGWLSDELKANLNDWTSARIATLPRLER